MTPYQREVRAWMREARKELAHLVWTRGNLKIKLASFRAQFARDYDAPSREDQELLSRCEAAIADFDRRIATLAYDLGIDALLPDAESLS